jgi:peptide/nickel transport system substrate-binding protein
MGRISAVLLGALLAAAVGCGGPQNTSEPEAPNLPRETADPSQNGGDPVRGDWLVLHQLSDPESLNPLTANDSGASQVLRWIFPSLLTLDNETFEMGPLLAREVPEVSEDGLTYTFVLREGITYSDGKPVTAEDIVFTVKATKHPEVRAPHARNYYNSVRDAVALDEHTMRIDLSEVYFRNNYSLGSLNPLPRHYYDPEGLLEDISVAEIANWDQLKGDKRKRAERFAKAFNEDFHRNPMGPGAYKLADPDKDWITGERITLVHRDDFWAPDDPDLDDAWVDRILFRIINDQEAALVALKAHDLDLLALRPIQHLRATGSARFQREFDKHVELLGGIMYIGWNQNRPAFSDKRVRQALSHLVDKHNIIDKVIFGLGVPIESPIFVKRPEHNSELEAFPFDPARAKELLAEAGWTDTDGDGILDKVIEGERVPLRFELMSNTGNEERRNVGLVVIDEFKKAGIDATFRGIDWSIMLDKVKNFDYDAVILGWTGGGAVPPDAYQIWHSSQAIAGGSNFIGFKNAEVDEILEKYRVEFDPAERKRLYDRFQEILYDEQPYTFLYTRESISAWDKRFHGVTWYPGIGSELNEWWVPNDQQRYQ